MVLSALAISSADAQTRKPTAQEVATIRDCATNYQDNVDEASGSVCVFNLVATPCTNTSAGNTNLGTANCYRVEWVIWDNLLNENLKNLMGALDNQQTASCARCSKPGSPTATPPAISTWIRFRARWRFRLGAVCAARETARRALLLWFFDQT